MTSAYVAFGLSAALESAVSAGLFEALLQEPATAAALAERTECDPLGVHKVLEVLAGAALLTREGDVYRLAAKARAELENGPGGYAAFRALWANTPKFLRSGARVSAMDGAGSERAAAYQAAVTGLGKLFEPAAKLLASGLRGRARILDIGAGSGVWSLEMLQGRADGTATALDFAEVLPCFRARAESLALTSRVETIAGDFQRADVPTTFERAVLANVLHLEDEPGAAALLKKAASVVVRGGDLVVVDVLDCVRQDVAYAAYGLHLAMRTRAGVAHPTAKLRHWLEQAGFARIRVVDLSSALPALGALIAER